MILIIILIILLLITYIFLVQAKLALNLVLEHELTDNTSSIRKLVLKHFNNRRKFEISVEILKLMILIALGYIFYVLYIDLEMLVLFLLLYIFLIVVFGQIIAERIAYLKPKKTLLNTIFYVDLLILLITPIYYAFVYISFFFGRLFGLKPKLDERTLTEEQIINIVEESSKTGHILEDESEMIQNIFEFDDTTADEVMTHRTEVSALNIDSTKAEVLAFIKNEQFTRFPVYSKDIDHIVGTIHIKDILAVIDLPKDKFSLAKIIREPYFIPSSKKTKDLFQEMQKSKNHIAIVLDEYGGTLGIVTIEDLIEEIVGNIFDEYDLEEAEINKIAENTYIVLGITNIYDVEDIIKADLPVEEYDTIGGFILGLTGRLITEEDKIKISYNDYEFEVLEVIDNVIKKIKITKVINNDE
mgnify:CR=1 FL=1